MDSDDLDDLAAIAHSLRRRSDTCRSAYPRGDSSTDAIRTRGKANAYEHCAELLEDFIAGRIAGSKS